NQLKALDDRYSSLHARFDNLIAQEMLLRENQNEIDPYAKRAIARLRDIGLADFADYSDVSRLTGEERYNEALKKAQELKKRLADKYKKQKEMPNESTADEFMLQAYLLLHIATLQQMLGNHEEMLGAIYELKEQLGLTKRDVPLTSQEKEAAAVVLGHLQER